MEETNDNKRCCSDCQTTKTPLWRGGPAGPKSLCNACGIRYRKQRRSHFQLMGIHNINHKSQTRKISSSVSSDGVAVKKQRCGRNRRLREEEQAAFSLLALSCSSVFA